MPAEISSSSQAFHGTIADLETHFIINIATHIEAKEFSQSENGNTNLNMYS